MNRQEFLWMIQSFWFAVRFKLPNQKSCDDCALGCATTSGNGWDEPCVTEWECNELFYGEALKPLAEAYEIYRGEIDERFATICPLYQELTDEERYAESLC